MEKWAPDSQSFSSNFQGWRKQGQLIVFRFLNHCLKNQPTLAHFYPTCNWNFIKITVCLFTSACPPIQKVSIDVIENTLNLDFFFRALLELKSRTVSVLNNIILWSTHARPIKSSESLYGAFGLIWDYFCWYNIFVVLLLETKPRDVSGSEFTKIFLDLMHAATCSHLINTSAIPSSKREQSGVWTTLPLPQ